MEDRVSVSLRYCGIPEVVLGTHLLCRFLPGPESKEAYDKALAFVAGKANHHFLTFVGEPGRGKTHLAIGIGIQWISAGKGAVKYYRVIDALDSMRREYERPPVNDLGTPLKTTLEWCKGVSLLILDDLGVEKQTDWALEKLEDIIDHRYINKLPLVVTTNMKPGQLSGRIAGRLKEGIVVTLGGLDYRTIIAKSREDTDEAE